MESEYDKSFKSPVQRAFYESFLLRNKYNVARLYALNVSASSKFKKDVKHLGQERKTKLQRIDNEIEDIRKQLGKLELAKNELSYLPTKLQEKDLPKFPVQIIHDVHKQSMCTPPVFLTHIKTFRKKSAVNKTKVVRKPLHVPKYTRPRLKEISKFVHDTLMLKNSTSGKSNSSFSSGFKETEIPSPRVSSVSPIVSICPSPRVISEETSLDISSRKSELENITKNIQPRGNTVESYDANVEDGCLFQYKVHTIHSLQSHQNANCMPSVEEVKVCLPSKTVASVVIAESVADGDGKKTDTSEPESNIKSITVQPQHVQLNDGEDKSIDTEKIRSNTITLRSRCNTSPITSVEKVNIALDELPTAPKVTFGSVIDISQEDGSAQNSEPASAIDEGYGEMKELRDEKVINPHVRSEETSRLNFDKRVSLAPVQEEEELGDITHNEIQIGETYSHEYDIVFKKQTRRKAKTRSKSVYILDPKYNLLPENEERKEAKKKQRSISIPVIKYEKENVSEKEMNVKTRSKSLHAIEYEKLFNTTTRKLSTPTRRPSLSTRRLSSVRNYDDFYDDRDFIPTTAKFISRHTTVVK